MQTDAIVNMETITVKVSYMKIKHITPMNNRVVTIDCHVSVGILSIRSKYTVSSVNRETLNIGLEKFDWSKLTVDG